MSFNHERLPDPESFFESEGLVLHGKGKWRTTSCVFHRGSDSMRVHIERGAFICMACGAKGGDVLAYYQAAHGLGFVDAAKALGAYTDDGTPYTGSTRPTPIPARVLLESVAQEVAVAAMVAADMVRQASVSDADKERLTKAAGRIRYVSDIANAHRA